MNRVLWVDCLKGIAITLVVVGHCFDGLRWIYWFHMPLFFMLSGYLYKSKGDYFFYLQKKSQHLLLPYFSFLVLGSIIQVAIGMNQQSLLMFFARQIYGGAALRGWFAVFWFVTCLFLCQQAYHWLYIKFGSNNRLMAAIMAVSYLLAMVDTIFIKNPPLPWAINIVLMALPFYWIGHLLSKYSINMQKLLPVAIAVYVVTLVLSTHVNIPFSMKGGHYGIIGLNIIVALAGSLIVQQISQAIAYNKILCLVASEVGSASMIVMYLHQPVQMALESLSVHSLIRTVIAIAIPFLIYKLILKSDLARRFLLGETQTKVKQLA
ncbi:acyltransferase family protein [Nostoc sp. CHAB 5844]|nr:acyltransferase family protein [Nostoc sp. CHAB 5844]